MGKFASLALEAKTWCASDDAVEALIQVLCPRVSCRSRLQLRRFLLTLLLCCSVGGNFCEVLIFISQVLQEALVDVRRPQYRMPMRPGHQKKR